MNVNKLKYAGAAVAMTLAGNAAASGGADFSGILSGLSGATAVTAIVAAAAILALVNFSGWGSRKVGGFIK